MLLAIAHNKLVYSVWYVRGCLYVCMLYPAYLGVVALANVHDKKLHLYECWCGDVLSPTIKSLRSCLHLIYIQVELHPCTCKRQ